MVLSRNKSSGKPKVKSRSRSVKRLQSKRKSRSPVRIPVQKGMLTKYGYHLKSNVQSRQKALAKALTYYRYQSVMAKVNVLYIFNKRRHPYLAQKATRDKEWLQRYNKKYLQ